MKIFLHQPIRRLRDHHQNRQQQDRHHSEAEIEIKLQVDRSIKI